ncbi:MAG: hypothetical protein ACLR0U_18595 [Enterocloster clostridioformis]
MPRSGQSGSISWLSLCLTLRRIICKPERGVRFVEGAKATLSPATGANKAIQMLVDKRACPRARELLPVVRCGSVIRTHREIPPACCLIHSKSGRSVSLCNFRFGTPLWNAGTGFLSRTAIFMWWINAGGNAL